MDAVTMRGAWLAVGCSSLLLATVTGCSSRPPPAPLVIPAPLPAGTARVTIDGRDAVGTFHVVSCVTSGSSTTVTISDDATAGMTATLSEENDLVVRSVSVRDVNGFTGRLDAALGSSMTEQTYEITGVAAEFTSSHSGRPHATLFTIAVSC